MLTVDERKLLQIFRALNADGKRVLIARAGELLELNRYTNMEPCKVLEYRTKTTYNASRT